MVVEKEEIIVEKEPMTVEKELIIAEKEPVVVEKELVIAEKEAVVAEKETDKGEECKSAETDNLAESEDKKDDNVVLRKLLVS